LNIFKDHARTKEAKLQIALAEIPYIRNNLRSFENSGHSRQKNSFQHIGGLGETWIETRKQLLIERETKLKKQLEKIKLNRDILRLNRVRKKIPIIAVVGYTNSGKTSLIKALTNDEKLIPKDQLFATLDVTVHSGRLPSNLTVLYTDTIGFISQIPTTLIHSFKATLSDICVADLIIHISDISHPNCELQEETVNKTLDDIEVPLKLKNSIIEVANKIDLVEDQNILNNCNKLLISSTKRIGLNELMNRIEKCLLINTGRLSKVLRYVLHSSNDYILLILLNL
jgi:GTP-binding protein HflX